MSEETDTYMLIENVSATDNPEYRVVKTGFLSVGECAGYLKEYHNGHLDSCGSEWSGFFGKYIIAKSIGLEFDVTGRIG